MTSKHFVFFLGMMSLLLFAGQPWTRPGAAAGAVPTEDGARDWPQWRGPDRNGISPETRLETNWGESGPRELWRRPIGVGYSGMAVAGERLYTLFQSDGEYVVSLDAASGRELWRHRIDSPYRDGQGDGPRGAPTVDGNRVYAVGAKGMFVALDAGSGRRLWSHDLTSEFRSSAPQWGFSTSPLVEGRLVLVEPGGSNGRSLAAFDKSSGELVWSSYGDRTGYSSPVAATINGVRQILFFTARHLVGVAPGDGGVLWEYPWQTSYDVNAATPLFVDPDKVFISSGYGTGGALIRIVGSGGSMKPETVWRNREMKNHFNSSLALDGYLYGFDDGTLKCLGLTDGEMQWRTRGFGKGSLISAGGKLIILGERGTLAVVEATPAEYRELARAEVLSGRCWTSPSLAGGRLYLRNQSEIVALDLAPGTMP